MSWEHFAPSATGTLNVTSQDGGEINIANYEIGTVSTGKSHSFYGYRLVISWNTEKFTGNDRRTMIKALRDCAEQLWLAGFQINVVGLTKEYSESGLSFNSGFGYLNRKGYPIHMMCELGSP